MVKSQAGLESNSLRKQGLRRFRTEPGSGEESDFIHDSLTKIGYDNTRVMNDEDSICRG